jgi:hypothetical protein
MIDARAELDDQAFEALEAEIEQVKSRVAMLEDLILGASPPATKSR